MTIKLLEFTAAEFLPYEGRKIVFERPSDQFASGGGGFVEMELLEVRAGKPSWGRNGQREPFALLFSVRGQAPLGPGLHRLIQEGFEPCDLFLSRVTVPERNDEGGAVMFYEAVFG
jgi:hypothetical protein